MEFSLHNIIYASVGVGSFIVLIASIIYVVKKGKVALMFRQLRRGSPAAQRLPSISGNIDLEMQSGMENANYTGNSDL